MKNNGSYTFDDKQIVIITGASSGIGEASAVEFAKRQKQCVIVLVARNQDKLEQVADKVSKERASGNISKSDSGDKSECTAVVYPCDVSKQQEVEKMSKDVLDRFGKIDVLVNNAGFAVFKNISKTTTEEIESQLYTNFLGMVYCTKSFLPQMIQQQCGHIVNVASLAASFGLPGIGPYCASKFAMLGFSESLSHELKGSGVGVTVVSPITVRTRFFEKDESLHWVDINKPYVLDPQKVAKKVVDAASSSRFEIVVPASARIAVWAKHTFPWIVNLVIARAFKKLSKNT